MINQVDCFICCLRFSCQNYYTVKCISKTQKSQRFLPLMINEVIYTFKISDFFVYDFIVKIILLLNNCTWPKFRYFEKLKIITNFTSKSGNLHVQDLSLFFACDSLSKIIILLNNHTLPKIRYFKHSKLWQFLLVINQVDYFILPRSRTFFCSWFPRQNYNILLINRSLHQIDYFILSRSHTLFCSWLSGLNYNMVK